MRGAANVVIDQDYPVEQRLDVDPLDDQIVAAPFIGVPDAVGRLGALLSVPNVIEVPNFLIGIRIVDPDGFVLLT